MKDSPQRPRVEDVERFLDALELERSNTRWLLEDLAGIEDSPETDAAILRAKHQRELEYG